MELKTTTVYGCAGQKLSYAAPLKAPTQIFLRNLAGKKVTGKLL
jgi:hypothetical protein